MWRSEFGIQCFYSVFIFRALDWHIAGLICGYKGSVSGSSVYGARTLQTEIICKPSKLNSLTKILRNEVWNPGFPSEGTWKHILALNFDIVIDYMVNYTGVW